MTYRYSPHLKQNARKMRAKMTEEECKLWFKFLKQLPVSIHRQKMIGNYIIDFYCAKTKTAIEIDGSQHYEEGQEEYDRVRSEYLNSCGINVIRYSNRDIHENFRNVCEDIWQHIIV